MRTSRRIQLTTAGRTLLHEAPIALAGLEQAVQRTQQVGSGIAPLIRLGYTPVTGFETLTTLLKALQAEHPDYSVEAREVFSAEIPDQLCDGDLDIGLALSPRLIDGVEGELLRQEPLSALLSSNHPLAARSTISLPDLRDETLRLFPRLLAPAYYDSIVAACQRAGFTPKIEAFANPPVSAMLASLSSSREINLTPTSFAKHAVKALTDVAIRDVVDTVLVAELSVLWLADDPSPAIGNVLATARRCADRHGWRLRPDASTADTA